MNEQDKQIIDVKIGEMEIAKAPIKLKTLLGSCVAVIIYDKMNKVGGMAHIFLPQKKENDNISPDSKFANTAVPKLLGEVIKKGGDKKNLMAYVVGGGNVLNKTREGVETIAEQNVNATLEAINKSGIMLFGCDVGRDKGCKVTFDLYSGDMNIIDLKGKLA